MIEFILYTAFLFSAAVIGSVLITMRKQFIEMRKQNVENEFRKIRNE